MQMKENYDIEIKLPPYKFIGNIHKEPVCQI